MKKNTRNYWIITNVLLFLIYLKLIGIGSFKDAESALNKLFNVFVSYLEPILFFDVSFNSFNIYNTKELLYSGAGIIIDSLGVSHSKASLLLPVLTF